MTSVAQGPPQYYGSNPNPVAHVNVMRDNHVETRRNQLYRLKSVANIQIVGGAILMCLGIVAIILMSYWSYFSVPIWSGLLFYVITGGVGMKASYGGKRCWVGVYIGLSILCSILGVALCEMYIWAAILEYGNNDIIWTCQPAGNNYIIVNCYTSETVRVTFDAFISAVGFGLFVVSVVAASYGCCAACACCQMCCKDRCCGECGTCCTPPPPPTTALFVTNANGMQQGGAQFSNQAGYYVVQSNNVVPMPPGTAYTQPPPGSQAAPPVYPGYTQANALPTAAMQPSYQGSAPIMDSKP